MGIPSVFKSRKNEVNNELVSIHFKRTHGEQILLYHCDIPNDLERILNKLGDDIKNLVEMH